MTCSISSRCVLVLAVGVCFFAWAEASYLEGTPFPFENCVQNTTKSPYFATRTNYTVNTAKKTSQFCMQIHVAPTCTPGGKRCCNTSINKIKFYPADGCHGSLASATITSRKANKTVTSIYWETHPWGNGNYTIVKITPLMQWLSSPADADGAVVCVNLRGNCWNLPLLAKNQEVLEYALYDKKVDNYECCPVGILDIPSPPMPKYPPYTAPPHDDGDAQPPGVEESPSNSPPPPSAKSPSPPPTASPKPPSPKPPSPKPPSPKPPSPKPPSPKPPSPKPPSSSPSPVSSPPPLRRRKSPPPSSPPPSSPPDSPIPKRKRKPPPPGM